MACTVVTGMGVIAPTAITPDEYWKAALRGETAIAPITRFDASQYPVQLAGEARCFVPSDRVPGRLLVQTDIWTQQGLAAVDAALADAELDPVGVPEYQMAIVTAGSAGGVEFGQREIEGLWSKGPKHVGAYQSIAWFYAATTGQVSIRHGMRGQCDALVSEATGGLDCFAGARRALEDGATVCVCGGADSALSPYSLVCQMSNGMLSRSSDPGRAYLPFHEDASGYVPAEGGAMFVVEDRDLAIERGTPQVYGVVAGHAATFSLPGESSQGTGLRRAIDHALRQAGADAAEVDLVVADAIGVPELDRAEAQALEDVSGPYGIPVTAPKSGLGRAYCGGSALDVVIALLSIRHGLIPPTPNVDRAAPRLRIDLVTGAPREADVRTALILARGYGGFNSALVLRHPDRQSG
jgi:minimal PKS chain-length factor (CLF/KS beta)